MNREMVSVRIGKIGCEAPAFFARLCVLELHTLRLQVRKHLPDVVDLEHPTRPDTRLPMTSRQIRVCPHSRLPQNHLDSLSFRANRKPAWLARICIVSFFLEAHLLGVEFKGCVLVLDDNRDVGKNHSRSIPPPN